MRWKPSWVLLKNFFNQIQDCCHWLEAVEQLFRAVTLSAQWRIRTVLYDAMKHVIFDQIETAVLGEIVEKHVDKQFEAGKASEAFAKMLLCNDEFPTQIASFAHEKIMDAISGQSQVGQTEYRSLETSANKHEVVPAEDSFGQGAQECMSSKSSSKQSDKDSKSCRARCSTCSQNHLSRSKTSSESDLTLSMSNTDSGRKT